MFLKEKEKELENKAWELYLVDYSSMDKNTYKQFKIENYIKTKEEKINKEELINDVENFISKLSKRKEGV